MKKLFWFIRFRHFPTEETEIVIELVHRGLHQFADDAPDSQRLLLVWDDAVDNRLVCRANQTDSGIYHFLILSLRQSERHDLLSLQLEDLLIILIHNNQKPSHPFCRIVLTIIIHG